MATTLRWALLAASFVVGAAGTLRMAGPAGAGHDDVSAIRLPTSVTAMILTLFAAAGVVFMIALARRMQRRRKLSEIFEVESTVPQPPWMRTVRQVVLLLNVVILAYLVWRGVIPLADLMALGGLGSGAAPGAAQPPLPDAPFLATWTFGALALVAGLGAVALAVWIGFGDRLAAWWELRTRARQLREDAEAAPEESLDALHAEGDVRRVIIRCYRRFARVAAGSGLERKPWQTPAEFMREALARRTWPREAVPTLTGLFELARFSRRELGRTDRDRALGALDEISTAIDTRAGDARR